MKTFSTLRVTLSASLTLWLLACGSDSTGPGPPSAEIAPIVERDGVPFEGQSIPEGVLDRLSPFRVVIVGETHLLREHREMMVGLVGALHARGFRQLLLEWPHMEDWLLSDFVNDQGLEPDWTPREFFGGDMITGIRDFNRSLPDDQRIQVRAIDVNLWDYGGASAFVDGLRTLSQHLLSPGPVAAFLEGGYFTPESQARLIGDLRDELQTRRSELVGAWGADLYETVAEMVDVEVASVTVRAMRGDDYDQSIRLREDEMKRLADLRLVGSTHGTLINVGGNHAQKEYLKGTEQEWLGDYLVHRSAAADGSVIVLVVTPARVAFGSGGAIITYDVMDASPANELFRLMYETWPDHTVFLPLDDPIFVDGAVAVNFEGTIYSTALKRIYDCVVQLPLAHRVQAP
jgi:hypothetical protein